MYKILRHPRVRNDLIQIASYILEHSNIITSERKIRAIEARIRRLQKTPHVGTYRHEIYPGLRAIPAAGKGVICFVVNDEYTTVFIICIVYAGGHWMDRLQDRLPELNPVSDDIRR